MNEGSEDNELEAEVDVAVERMRAQGVRREIAYLEELLACAYARAAKPDCHSCHGRGRMQDGYACVCVS